MRPLYLALSPLLAVSAFAVPATDFPRFLSDNGADPNFVDANSPLAQQVLEQKDTPGPLLSGRLTEVSTIQARFKGLYGSAEKLLADAGSCTINRDRPYEARDQVRRDLTSGENDFNRLIREDKRKAAQDLSSHPTLGEVLYCKYIRGVKITAL